MCDYIRVGESFFKNFLENPDVFKNIVSVPVGGLVFIPVFYKDMLGWKSTDEIPIARNIIIALNDGTFCCGFFKNENYYGYCKNLNFINGCEHDAQKIKLIEKDKIKGWRTHPGK